MTRSSLDQRILIHCCWLDEVGSVAGRARAVNLIALFALEPPSAHVHDLSGRTEGGEAVLTLSSDFPADRSGVESSLYP